MTQTGFRKPEARSTEDLLRAWEAHGLLWATSARLTYLLVGALVIGLFSPAPERIVSTWALIAIGTGLTLYCLRLARRQQRLGFVGLAGVSFDLLVLINIPILQYSAVGGTAVSAAVLLKNNIILVCLVLMVINTMASRPLYPALVTAGSILLHIALGVYALQDPRVRITSDTVETILGPGVNPGVYAWLIITLLLVGGFLTLLARTARRTIQSVVALETANRQIRERQAQLVMESKMAGLANLVAGIAHEINTPLGAMLSGVATSETCQTRLSECLESAGSIQDLRDDPKGRRSLDVLRATAQTVRQAGQRIASLVSSLKDFARLDQAEVQRADLRAGLDSTLALIRAEIKEKIEIVKEYQDVPAVSCRPKEINQVFLTLLTNAFEAMNGGGTLRLRTTSSKDLVTVEVSDTGRGLPADQLERLFEIQFTQKPGRMGVGLGLPTAKSIAERHGGTLEVASEKGAGTTFRLSLPISGPDHS